MLNVPEYLGFPLLEGETFSATAASDLFLQWNPTGFVSFQRVHHPLPNMDIDISPTARFGGYPPVQASNGTVLGEDATHRFLAVITGHAQQAWHRDLTNNLGVPLTRDTMIVSGFGGDSATEGIFAVDTKEGKLLWSYPPRQVPEDPQDTKTITSPKAIVAMVPEGREHDVQLPNGKRVRAKELVPQVKQVPVQVPQPTSRQPWAHWRNPGIVSVGDVVIGEAAGEIVALNQETGAVIWRVPLGKDQAVRSLVATPDHVVLCVSTLLEIERNPIWVEDRKGTKTFLLALEIKDGKEAWRQSVPRAGNLIIADNRLYLMDGTLHAFESNEPEAEDQSQIGAEVGSK